MSSLAFLELVNVFDFFVWLSIVGSVVISVVFKTFMFDFEGKKIKLNLIIMDTIDYLKLLVDQSQPFLHAGRSHTWRVSSAFYLLPAIVLSSAYRNTNVYNMVKPRMSVPYEYFSQLVNDSFSIFTRKVASAGFQGLPRGGLPNEFYVKIENHTILFYFDDLELSATYLVSELDKLTSSVNSAQKTEWDKTKIERLMNYSRLHPGLVDIFNMTGIQYEGRKTDGFTFPDMLWASQFRQTEVSVLEDALEKCDKVAIILPDHMCRDLADEMMKFENVYVGKEALQESITGFVLAGYIPVKVFDRIRVVELAGLWEKWRRLAWNRASLVWTPDTSKDTRAFHKPTMTGNMAVLFVVLLIGLAGSICIFIMEFVAHILWKIICCCIKRKQLTQIVTFHYLP